MLLQRAPRGAGSMSSLNVPVIAEARNAEALLIPECAAVYLSLPQVYTVTLHGEQLRTDFRVMNTGDKPFDFTTALHTYFEVLHVDKAKVRRMMGMVAVA
jgi:D-hexose-6-phosphate mutarotase